MNAYFRLKNRVKQKLNEIEKKHIVLCTASKQGAVAQVRGQLDDQDSQKTEIYGSRGRENAVKYGMTTERRMQGRSRMVQNRMQNVKRATGAQVRGQLDDQDSQNR